MVYFPYVATIPPIPSPLREGLISNLLVKIIVGYNTSHPGAEQ